MMEQEEKEPQGAPIIERSASSPSRTSAFSTAGGRPINVSDEATVRGAAVLQTAYSEPQKREDTAHFRSFRHDNAHFPEFQLITGSPTTTPPKSANRENRGLPGSDHGT